MGKKVTDLTVLTIPANGDLIVIDDISDIADSSGGTSKKITWLNFLGQAVGSIFQAWSAVLDLWAASIISPSDVASGWIPVSDTFVYVSASSFKITGADRTSIYTKGTRVKFTQTTAKYAVVVSSSFAAGDTTVTILVNTDYTIANVAITSPYYSYVVNPQGYPNWFTCAAPNFDVTALDNASGGQPTTSLYKLNIIGKMIFGVIKGSGTKATTNPYIRFAVPVAYVNTNDYITFGSAFIDNSADGIKIGIVANVNNTSYIWITTQANMTDNSTVQGFGASFCYEF